MSNVSFSELIETPEGPIRTFWARVAEDKIDWQGIVALQSPSRDATTALVWRRPASGAPFSWAVSDMRKVACDFLCKQLQHATIDIIDLESLLERQGKGLHVEVTRAREGRFDSGYLMRFKNWNALAAQIGVPGGELLELMHATVNQGDVSFDVRGAFKSYMPVASAIADAPRLCAKDIRRLRRFNAQMSVEQFARWLQVSEADVLAWEGFANIDGRLAPGGSTARLLEILERNPNPLN